MTGHEYKLRVARYIAAVYGPRGVDLYDEVTVGTTIIGKPRRIDLLLLEREPADQKFRRALAVECKYQDSAGTVDEKIPYALKDLESLRMPAVIVYAGSGFSEGVLHLLKASPLAAYCMPDDSLKPLARTRTSEAIHGGTWQLDHVLAQTFGWWDVILGERRPLAFVRSET
ncbi:MAG: hypothetical protein HOW73_42270 [Polyangiaceae bacterium]|nr:hypothetical protein [Polyangiaceae bacterium]